MPFLAQRVMSKLSSISASAFGGACLLAVTAIISTTPTQATAQADVSIPDLSSNGMSWGGANGREFLPVPGSPPAVTFDPENPYINNAINRETGQQQTYHIADLTNANLMQWAKDIMKIDNDEVLAGKIAYMPAQSCKPWGTPAVLQSGGPFIIIQSPTEVVIIEEGERLARHIYLNVSHSADPKPSWNGESVGHYEDNALVIDTIGITNETFVDFFRTPHTEQLHVMERWQLSDDGTKLDILITVDDPGTYYEPWQVMRHLERGEEELGENICREGNFNLFDYGIPIEETPDF